jgi:hypothetical protein
VFDLVREQLGDRRLMDHRGGGNDLRMLVKDLTDDQLRERVRFGASIRNSETGHGAFAIEDYIRLLICSNGAVVNAQFRMAHLGKKSGEEDFTFRAADTQRLEDAALFLRVRDRLLECFSDRTEKTLARSIVEGKAPVELPPEQPALTFVKNVGATFDLTDKELDVLQEEAAHELARGRPMSRFAVSQGFTALARRVGEAGDFDRKYELEQAGWKILTDPVTKLLKAAA